VGTKPAENLIYRFLAVAHNPKPDLTKMVARLYKILETI